MARILEQDRTGLFTVVGAPPIAEEHRDARSHLDSTSGTTGALIAGAWVTLYVVIVAAAIVGRGGVNRAVALMTAALPQ